jgi:hypothetical protein
LLENNDEHVRIIEVDEAQADEKWSFVGKRRIIRNIEYELSD